MHLVHVQGECIEELSTCFDFDTTSLRSFESKLSEA